MRADTANGVRGRRAAGPLAGARRPAAPPPRSPARPSGDVSPEPPPLASPASLANLPKVRRPLRSRRALVLAGSRQGEPAIPPPRRDSCFYFHE